MNKAELRKKYLEIRKGIQNRSEKTIEICRYVKNTAAQCSTVFAYYAVGSEADITSAFSEMNNVYCPISYENSEMKFAPCSRDTKTGMYGITEPCGKPVDIVPDIVFVPGVAFDISGTRIGYGKGYYDRFLSKINTVKIGVCFEEQLSYELLEHDAYDIKMDMIITQKGIYTPGKERIL